MRTTVTLDEALLNRAQLLSGVQERSALHPKRPDLDERQTPPGHRRRRRMGFFARGALMGVVRHW